MNKLLTLSFLLFLSCTGAFAQFQPRTVGVVNGQRIRDNSGNIVLDAGAQQLLGNWALPSGALVFPFPSGWEVTYLDFSNANVHFGLDSDGDLFFHSGNPAYFDAGVYFAGGYGVDYNGDASLHNGTFTGNIVAPSFTGDGSLLTGILFANLDSPPSTLSGYGITDAQAKATTAQLLAQSAAVASVATVTAPDDGNNHLYTCGGTITVTAISANTIALQVTYTDETNTSRTQSFFGEGLTVAAVSTTGGFTFPPLTIWAKPNTAITIKTTVTGAGTETYDVAGWIQKLD